jgi:multisubunit Na+/H+ antiporter MnhE subunit
MNPASPKRGTSTALRSSIAILVAAAWVLFVAGIRFHEMLVGLGVDIAATIFLVNLCKFAEPALRLEWRDVIQCWRLPWYVLSDIWQIMVVLARDIVSAPRAGSYFRVSGFKTSKRDPHLRGRTVLATVYTTVSPNSIVIGIDPELSRMLFHQLKRSRVSKMTRSLGAQS